MWTHQRGISSDFATIEACEGLFWGCKYGSSVLSQTPRATKPKRSCPTLFDKRNQRNQKNKMGWRIKIALLITALVAGVFKKMNWTETSMADIWALKDMIEEIEKMTPDEWKESATRNFDRMWNATKTFLNSTWPDRKKKEEVALVPIVKSKIPPNSSKMDVKNIKIKIEVSLYFLNSTNK